MSLGPVTESPEGREESFCDIDLCSLVLLANRSELVAGGYVTVVVSLVHALPLATRRTMSMAAVIFESNGIRLLE